jgi:hypothetical protein
VFNDAAQATWNQHPPDLISLQCSGSPMSMMMDTYCCHKIERDIAKRQFKGDVFSCILNRAFEVSMPTDGSHPIASAKLPPPSSSNSPLAQPASSHLCVRAVTPARFRSLSISRNSRPWKWSGSYAKRFLAGSSISSAYESAYRSNSGRSFSLSRVAFTLSFPADS